MRPRSRLLSKRGLLLPTIREGSEETVRELNETNTLRSQSVSSEDYLLSICHLALPTFPSRDVSGHPSHHAAQRRLRLTPRGRLLEEEEEEEAEAEGAKNNLGFGSADPLEYLYGQQNPAGVGRREVGSRSHSIPSTSNPGLPWQRKNSCPEFHTTIPNTSPKHRAQTRRGGPAGGERSSPALKQSLISQWISECRSAWREARVRACMLPAIAEI
ncbi:uncharacterized protein ACB058_012134 [Synchiropus picturatus]